uniref:LIM zinc-binding domain-containing protein n=1 Tax=Cynoglossus semilaevis TaxID=244447 RepID=A0A3P8VNZ1_CYNSE
NRLRCLTRGCPKHEENIFIKLLFQCRQLYPKGRNHSRRCLIRKATCFCCKHCRKKLSIHNFSLLRGEIYCPAHYQQHFKRGNSAEGLKPKQCKDHSPIPSTDFLLILQFFSVKF